MASDYVPQQDDEFFNWLTTFGAWVTTNGTTHGLTAPQLMAFNTLKAAWEAAYADYLAKRTAYHAAAQEKDAQREEVEAMARQLAGIVQKNPDTTDEDRVEALLNVPKERTEAPIATAHPVPTKVDTSDRAILRLFIADSATPNKKAKPEGQKFCEIREQIGGTAPTNPESMAFLASVSRAPFRSNYEPEEVGQKVWFALRWVNTRGNPGPWRPIFSAVVPS